MWTQQDYSLLRIKYLQMLRRLQHLNLDSYLKSFLFFNLISVFWGLCFYLVQRLLFAAYAIDVIGPLIIKRLIAFGLFALFIIVAGSHVLSAYSSLFKAQELPKIVSSPYPNQRLYLIQCLETLLHGGWVLAMFCLPLLIAYGIQLQANPLFYPVVIVGIAGFFVISGSVGILIMLVIARWIISRPVQMAISTVLFLGGFISLFLYMAVASNVFTQGVTATKLGESLANMRLTTLPYLPSQWMSELMVAAQIQDWWRVGLFLSLIISTALMLWSLVIELGSRWYADAWLWTQERIGTKQLLHGSRPYKKKPLWIIRLLPRRIGSLIYKEIILFVRDFSQWGQLVLILALTLFYILQTQNVMSGETANRMKVLLACFNVILLGFIQATLSLRYTYPSISLEGKQFWVVACAENGIERTFFMKYYLHTFFLLLLGLGLGTVLNRIVNVDPTLNYISLLVLFLFAFGFTSWSLGLGAIFNKFEATNVADVSSDTGTLVAMILTVFYLGLSLSFLTSFALMYTPGATLSDIMALNQENGLMLYFTLFLVVQTCSILLPTAYGLKKLKEAVILR
jgi:ABC-2 type transport system permease protein